LLIEEYFRQIEADISQSVIVIDNLLIRNKRSLYIGFIESQVSWH